MLTIGGATLLLTFCQVWTRNLFSFLCSIYKEICAYPIALVFTANLSGNTAKTRNECGKRWTSKFFRVVSKCIARLRQRYGRRKHFEGASNIQDSSGNAKN